MCTFPAASLLPKRPTFMILFSVLVSKDDLLTEPSGGTDVEETVSHSAF